MLKKPFAVSVRPADSQSQVAVQEARDAFFALALVAGVVHEPVVKAVFTSADEGFIRQKHEDLHRQLPDRFKPTNRLNGD
ncbi:MAG: hypothetical protein WDZ85_03995 [Candidatus Paceibacterota bacterium]